jgi:hypothetical protein
MEIYNVFEGEKVLDLIWVPASRAELGPIVAYFRSSSTIANSLCCPPRLFLIPLLRAAPQSNAYRNETKGPPSIH